MRHELPWWLVPVAFALVGLFYVRMGDQSEAGGYAAQVGLLQCLLWETIALALVIGHNL